MADDLVDIEQEEALRGYLRARGRIGASESPQMRVLAGGVSNKTVWVRRSTGEEWVLKQALPKLRVKADWFSDPARIRREAQGMATLHHLCPPGTITELIFEDPEQYLLCMSAVPQPHENFKAMLMRGAVELDRLRQFGSLLGTIHRRALESPDLAARFQDRSFFESLRLDPYYRYTAQQVPAAAAFMTELADSTLGISATLVHGDYSPKNVLVHQGQLVLLDHEVIHWGDAGFDIGFAMAHLLSKAHHFRRSSYFLAIEEFWEGYQAEAGLEMTRSIQPRAASHTLGCLLARVAGKSPLEYLTDAERQVQQRVAVSLMGQPPATLEETISRFLMEIRIDVQD